MTGTTGENTDPPGGASDPDETEPPVGFARRMLVAEAVRNLVATPIRSIVRILVFGVVAAAVVTVSVDHHAGLVEDFERLVSEGRDVFVVTATGVDMDAQDCESLNARTGVLAAGSIRSVTRYQVASVADLSVEVVKATPGMIDLVRGRRASILPGWLVGTVVSERLAVGPGSQLTLTAPDDDVAAPPDVDIVVATRLARTPRMASWNQSVVAAVPPMGLVRSCYVSLDASIAERSGPALGTAFPASTVSVAARLRPELAQAPQPEVGFERTDRRAAALLSAIGLLAAVGAIWERKLDFALYRSLGARWNDIAYMLWCDVVVVAAIGGLGGAGLAMAIAADDLRIGLVRGGLLRDGATALGILAIAPLLATLLVCRRPASVVFKGD